MQGDACDHQLRAGIPFAYFLEPGEELATMSNWLKLCRQDLLQDIADDWAGIVTTDQSLFCTVQGGREMMAVFGSFGAYAGSACKAIHEKGAR